jgi:SNF2 family DNA or RNA helicase
MGVIAGSAIRKFLERPRDDYRRYKSFSDDRLQRHCDRLPVQPPIWYKLNRDQKICFIIGAETGRFAFWADTGTGKTLLSIALILYWRKLGYLDRAIVLVPNKVNKYEWAREVRKWAPKKGCVVLSGSSLNKWEQVDSTSQPIIVETYAGLVRMVTDVVEAKKKKGKRKKLKLQINQKLMRRLTDIVQGIVLDESIMVVAKKRRGSLMHRVALKIADLGEIAFALNGTPHGRDPTDLWGQMRIVDGGETLGETLGLYRAAFYTEKQNFWGGAEYTFKKKMAPELNRILANRSIRIEADESSLPKRVPIRKYVTLGADAQTIYERAKADLISAHGNFREMQNAFIRMRQISSGFIGYHDDEMGVKAKYTFDSIPKLDLLASLIESVQFDHKSVVFHDFVYSGDLIAQELKSMGIGFVRLKGSKEDPLVLLDRFDRDKKCRVFILNNFEAYGLNLQVASYGFYYESPVPVIKRVQGERRIIRQHSRHKRKFIYDLIAAGTWDERILDFHAEGADLFDSVVNGRVRPDRV